ncbi:MFS transporter [Pedobacter sp. AW31-3R]|uniref:MFS transporter n=1 Tax=Pedobacter sp. AW31-3R TaxID=3445781 RepID=UPI003FA08384
MYRNSFIWRQRLGYGIADLGCNLVWQMLTIYQMYFYTDIMKLPAVSIGLIFLVTRLIDGAGDLLMGFIIDNTKSRWGKSRPYFLWGALPFALFSAAAFYVPQLSVQWKISYAFVTYLGLSLTYTVVNMPLTSILPNLTADLNERTNLATSRILFSFIGATVVGTATLPLVNYLGGTDLQTGYFLTMLGYGAVAAIFLCITFSMVKETVRSNKVSFSVRISFRSLLSNRPWQLFALNIIFMWGAYFLQQGGLLYYYTYCAKANTEMIATITTLSAILPALGTFSTPFLARFMSKKNMFLLSSVVHLLGIFMLIFSAEQFNLLIAGTIISALGFGLRHTAYFSMQADPVDYGESKTGINVGGLIAAINQFIGKIAMAVSGVVAVYILSKGGYHGGQPQTESSLKAIKMIYLYLPVILVCISMAIMCFYQLEPLSPKDENPANA